MSSTMFFVGVDFLLALSSLIPSMLGGPASSSLRHPQVKEPHFGDGRVLQGEAALAFPIGL